MGVNFFQLLPCHRIPEEELNQDYRGNGGDNCHYLELFFRLKREMKIEILEGEISWLRR